MPAVNAKMYEGSVECTPVLAPGDWRYVGTATGTTRVYLPPKGTFREIYVKIKTADYSDATFYALYNPNAITHLFGARDQQYNDGRRIRINIYASDSDNTLYVELYEVKDISYSPIDRTSNSTMIVFVR